ncbi:bifunctional molybdopterin-guanine dinucleotide biosynthesis adaptor protein MobB/molybdopterin molybdotransferase MoeA [Halomonas sp. HP20-15]|uniref:bifunctional molybdopterin-guanine dinucleotide biosynthesis adaptor protein MobB/molybdopterin molybdotransferase MoeA n=1 Tax=Halomonas sp. HP20-15 TaxID=3085901 RepID=UPI0029811F29|nr:bifunctional molybdopterin-guanine dinucleotide biosynthesis adaptor protein MobB/molybdopterin molybdotransferase MoeA [Halomonas sp. HP20-15]MDW5378055.1 bifunctional molybdopterin-guanine dinucleotide biosynthesis adaptor protein MobB/molybdopterin molybdotransferase MoeA [Halomonas sp. HP20-15]
MTLSCFALGEQMLDVDEALAALSELVATRLSTERLPLTAAARRVLAEDCVSPIDVPQNTNAAMDGIALAWPAPTELSLVGEVLAGHRFERPLSYGEAVTITTGAPLPPGADTVIMHEQLDLDARARTARIHQAQRVSHGQNVRHAGEDIARGSRAVRAGTRLRPQHMGLLASLGIDDLEVVRRPRVAIFSTGDEVTMPGEALGEAGIYDANRYSLRGLLEALGCEVDDLGILVDRPEAIRDALAHAATRADMVITSGGVSSGQADWVKPALSSIGRLGFWRIAMRPGRPLAFGVLGEDGVPFFGLPGNPVAVMVTFLQFVQPLLRRLQGEHAWQPTRWKAIADEAMHSRSGRIDFHRGIYRVDETGQVHVRTTGQQGSGILSSMVAANCLIEIEASRADIGEGETVLLQPFGELT